MRVRLRRPWRPLAWALVALLASAMRSPIADAADFDGTIAGGGRLYSERDSSTSVSGIELFVPAGVDRQANNEGGVAALTAEMLLDRPIADGDRTLPLQDVVRRRGGRIAAEIAGQHAYFYLEARNARLAELASLCAKAFAAPLFDRETLATAVRTLRPRVVLSSRNSLTAGTLMFRGAFYSSSNAGAPPLGTLADLERMKSDDAATFYRRAYRLGGASATLIGDTGDANRAAAKELLRSLPRGSSRAAPVRSRPALSPQTSIISFRDVSAPWVLLGFSAPTADSEDFGPMLVLTAIVEDAFTRESTTTVPLASKPVGLEYDFFSTPATLVLYIDGAATDQSMALRELDILRMLLGSNALTSQYVDRYRRMAAGVYTGRLLTLSQRAQEIAGLADFGLGADGVNTVLRQIALTKPADIRRVLKRYVDASTILLVLPHGQESR
jgi:zinc protease